MTQQLEILPPAGRPAAIATVADFVGRLARHFPKHATEIAEWAGMYQRALGNLCARQLVDVFERTLAGWEKGTPPKPAHFAALASPVALAGDAVSPDAEAYTTTTGERRCTRAGYVRARQIASRMVDDALRLSPVALTANEASRIAERLKPLAWLAACDDVLGLPPQPIDVTPALVDEVRRGIAADATDPVLRLWGRTGIGRELARAPRTESRLREAAAAHHARVMGEEPPL